MQKINILLQLFYNGSKHSKNKAWNIYLRNTIFIEEDIKCLFIHYIVGHISPIRSNLECLYHVRYSSYMYLAFSYLNAISKISCYFLALTYRQTEVTCFIVKRRDQQRETDHRQLDSHLIILELERYFKIILIRYVTFSKGVMKSNISI